MLQVEDMQVGVAWAGGSIISLSLSGDLNTFDAAALGRPISVMRGHNKTINALAIAGGR
jgi:hypothetical protein